MAAEFFTYSRNRDIAISRQNSADDEIRREVETIEASRRASLIDPLLPDYSESENPGEAMRVAAEESRLTEVLNDALERGAMHRDEMRFLSLTESRDARIERDARHLREEGRVDVRVPRFSASTMRASVLDGNKRDITYITAKMGYKVAELSARCSRWSRRFSDKLKEDKIQLGEDRRDLGMARAMTSSAIASEKRDNERYYSFIMYDTSSRRAARKPDSDVVLALREKLYELLERRDEINARLTELYLGSEGARRNKVAKRDKAVSRACEKQYRRLLSTKRRMTFEKVGKMYREKLYALMDEQVELAGVIEKCKYILTKERPKGKTLRDTRQLLDKSKKKFNKNRSEITRTLRIAIFDARDRRIKNQAMISSILILHAVLGIAGVIAFMPEQVIAFIDQYLPFLSGLIPRA
jgi:hypothetical protein